MDIKQLCKYFNRRDITVRKAIKKMCDNVFEEYKFLVNKRLEKYKMELTELYIETGYPYDNFFHKN